MSPVLGCSVYHFVFYLLWIHRGHFFLGGEMIVKGALHQSLYLWFGLPLMHGGNNKQIQKVLISEMDTNRCPFLKYVVDMPRNVDQFDSQHHKDFRNDLSTWSHMAGI